MQEGNGRKTMKNAAELQAIQDYMLKHIEQIAVLFLIVAHDVLAYIHKLFLFTNMHTCIDACMHTYIQTCIHTYIHTCMHACTQHTIHT